MMLSMRDSPQNAVLQIFMSFLITQYDFHRIHVTASGSTQLSTYEHDNPQAIMLN